MVGNIDSIVNSDLKFAIIVRCNVDRRNQDEAEKLAKYLKDKELHNKISFYTAPIHSWGNDAQKMSASLMEYAEWEIKLFDQLIQMGFNVRLVPPRSKIACMGVNKNSVLIDPYGNIFGCTEESLVPAYEKDGINTRSSGNIRDLPDDAVVRNIPGRAYNNFTDEIESKKWPCHDCHVLPMCGGKCPKEWKEGRVPCPPFKYNIAARMLLHYARSSTK